MALGADGIPAFEIFAAILFDVLFQGVQRPVRRGERHVQEERLIFFISTMFTNELRAVLANGGGVVKVLRKLRDRRVIQSQGLWCVETAGASNSPKKSIKPALPRPVVFGAGD